MYLAFKEDEVELYLGMLAFLADLVEGVAEVGKVCVDPDDDKYLVAAAEGRAEFIVTGDRQFLDPREHEGIRIVTPRAFLALLSGVP